MRLAFSSKTKCFVTACRVISMCSHNSLNVCPFCLRNSSSNFLRLRSASALKTTSIGGYYATKRLHVNNTPGLEIAARCRRLRLFVTRNFCCTVHATCQDYEHALANARRNPANRFWFLEFQGPADRCHV